MGPLKALNRSRGIPDRPTGFVRFSAYATISEPVTTSITSYCYPVAYDASDNDPTRQKLVYNLTPTDYLRVLIFSVRISLLGNR